ncbi:MAG: hypothetical protein L0191_19715, partial [Acidobacteria bacterium]|nr:hypothetical protein [Acidobacteriota bacterium]
NVREADEIYYFLRIVSAALAGIAAWNLAERWGPQLGIPRTWLPAAVLITAFPLALPSWWSPKEMDPYFEGSLAPLPDPLVRAMDYVRRSTAPEAVFISGKQCARYVAALGGRRLLLDRTIHPPPGYQRRVSLETVLLEEGSEQAATELRTLYGVSHVVVEPDLLGAHPRLTLDRLRSRPNWEEVFVAGDPERDFVAIFRVGNESAGPSSNATRGSR